MAPSAVKQHAKESCTSIGSGPFSPLPWPRAMSKQYLARTSLMSTALTKLTIIIIHFYISDLILYVCLNMYAYRYPSIYFQAVWFDIHAEELCKWVLVSSIKTLDNGESGSSFYIIQYRWSLCALTCLCSNWAASYIVLPITTQLWAVVWGLMHSAHIKCSHRDESNLRTIFKECWHSYLVLYIQSLAYGKKD